MQKFDDLYICCSCLEYFEMLQKEFFNLSIKFLVPGFQGFSEQF